MPKKKHSAVKNSQAETNGKTVKTEHQNPISRNWFYLHIRELEYTSFVLSGLLGLTLSAMANTNMSAAVWTTCGAVIFAAVGGACWWQKYLWDKALEPLITTATEVAPARTVPAAPSTIGPHEITQRLREAMPYQKEEIANTYIGAPVVWRLPLFSISRRSEGRLSVSFSIGNYSAGMVYLVVPDKGNDFLRLVKRDDLLTVKGNIEKVNSMDVELKEEGGLIER